LPLGTGKIGPVSILQRGFRTELFERTTTGAIPAGTRSARVVVTFNDYHWAGGAYNHSHADNLSFTVGAPLPAPINVRFVGSELTFHQYNTRPATSFCSKCCRRL
jgi:hypothetical protein